MRSLGPLMTSYRVLAPIPPLPTLPFIAAPRFNGRQQRVLYNGCQIGGERMRRNCPNCVEKEKRIRQLEAALLRISNEAAAAGSTVGQPSLVDLEGFRRLTKRETEVLQMLRSGQA